MSGNPARLAGGFLALAAVWVGAYWMWEPSRSAGVSFAEQGRAPEPAALPGPTPVEVADPPPAGEPESPAAAAGAGSEPPRSAQPAVGAVAPEFRDHAVRRGETFESISRLYFGTSRYAPAIAASNPFVSPTSLRAGQKIRVPVDPENVQGRPAPGADPGVPEPEFLEYVVVKGDTLSEIAQRFYGSLRYAEVIYNANRDTMRSADDLQIGDVLRIPSRESVLGAGGG